MHDKLQISFEFFPPKTPEGQQHLQAVVKQLAQYQPQFFSVTFGAGGSTRTGTLQTVAKLQELTSITVAPHIACIGSTRKELLELLHLYQSKNIKRLVALRGDFPSGTVAGKGEFKYASDLVSLIREATGHHFHIEVAAYPEVHPQADNLHSDMLNLKKKYEAGANSAITQFFFNADAYFYFRDECSKQRINLAIVPGIMPIVQFTKLAQFSSACGAEIPRWMRKRMEGYGDDIDSIKAFGREVVANLCDRLITGGVPGLHFYTLNKAEASMQLIDFLGIRTVKNKSVKLRELVSS